MTTIILRFIMKCIEGKKMNIDKSLERTFEELGWYVYALVYPKEYTKIHKDKKGIFYVGKGVHTRVLQHLEDAETTNSKTDKLDTIRDIRREGFDIDYYILRHQIPSEEEAYLVESVCINLLSYKNFDFCSLKNDVTGHGENEFGIKNLDELKEQYGNLPYLKIKDDETLLCICINKQYGKKDDEGNDISIYDAVRASWKINASKANKCKYVLAEYHGITRGVFKVNKKGWQKCNDSKRFFFEGKDVSETEGKKYMNCILPEKKKGVANPLRYLTKKDNFIEGTDSINPTACKHKIISICVNRKYGTIDENGKEIDAYRAVRSSWILKPEKANQYEFVIAEYHGKCVGIYSVNHKKWKKSNFDKRRYFFDGKEAPKEVWNQYIYKELPKREQGAANPVRYFDNL